MKEKKLDHGLNAEFSSAAQSQLSTPAQQKRALAVNVNVSKFHNHIDIFNFQKGSPAAKDNRDFASIKGEG